jgi:hypothetical protein
MFHSGWRLLALAGLCSVSLLGACTPRQEGADDPKQRLNEYISRSFAVAGPQDRATLASYLTGEAKTRIQGWSDEQFRQAFIDSKRQFIKLAFKEMKAVSAKEVNITYELSYQSNYSDAQGKPHDAKVTNRKLAQMVRENDQWMIADVRNIKELVEYKNEMSLP